MRQTPKSRHTPGPWHIINEKTIIGADSPRQGYVAYVNLHRSSDNGEPDGFANAALIAAAPELLEALRLIGCQSVGDDWTYQQAYEFIKATARKAIAKAEGR